MKYMLYCHNCNHKVFTDGKDLNGLAVIPTAPLQKRGDGKSTETVDQKKKIKCPICGYIFKIVRLADDPVVETPKPDFEREMPKDPSDIFDKDGIPRRKRKN